MRLALVTVLIATSIAPGCKKHAGGGGQCEATANDLRQWLSILVREGRSFGPEPASELALLDERPEIARPSTASPTWQATIHIDQTDIDMHGQLLVSTPEAVARQWSPRGLKELYAALTGHLRAACDAGVSEQQMGAPALLIITRDAPWRAVRASLASLYAAGIRKVDVAFAIASAAAEPKASSADHELARLAEPKGKDLIWALEPDKRRKHLDPIFDDCKALHRAVATVDAVAEETKDPAAIDQAIASAYPRAVAECDCKVDIEAVRGLLWLAFGRRHSGGRLWIYVPIELGPNRDAPAAVAVDDSTPWHEAHRELLAVASQGRPLLPTGKGATDADEAWLEPPPDGFCPSRTTEP